MNATQRGATRDVPPSTGFVDGPFGRLRRRARPRRAIVRPGRHGVPFSPNGSARCDDVHVGRRAGAGDDVRGVGLEGGEAAPSACPARSPGCATARWARRPTRRARAAARPRSGSPPPPWPGASAHAADDETRHHPPHRRQRNVPRRARRRRRHRHQLDPAADRRRRARRPCARSSSARWSRGWATASTRPAARPTPRRSGCSPCSSEYAARDRGARLRADGRGDDLGGARRRQRRGVRRRGARPLGLDGRTLSGDEEARLTFLGATAARDARRRAAARDRHRRRLDRAGRRRARRGRLPRLDPGRGRAPHGAPPALRPAGRGGAGGARARRPRGVRGGRAGGGARAGAARPSRWPGRRRRARRSTSGSSPTTGARRGARAPRDALVTIRARLAALTTAERRAVPGLHPDRAPMIVAGTILLPRRWTRSGSSACRGLGAGHPLGRGSGLRSGILSGLFWTFVRLPVPRRATRILGAVEWAVVPPAVACSTHRSGRCRIIGASRRPGHPIGPSRHVPLPVLTGPT